MIKILLSRTPLRIGFIGGGTDLPSFYKKEVGEVLSTTINKYIHISVNKRFDKNFRLSYSDFEIVDSVDKIKHKLIRETLKFMKMNIGKNGGLEITSTADVHGRGSGLGSSGAFVVGLLNALHYYKNGYLAIPEQLAEEATKIEIDLCKEPIGKQDQTIVAFGGFNRIQFFPDDKVIIKPINCSLGTERELERSLLLFYTGIDRKANSILKKQIKITKGKKFGILQKMRDLVAEAENTLQHGKLDDFGKILDKNWQLKKQLVSGISNKIIDRLYNKTKRNGAIGGKIGGAGGRGFLLIYARPRYQDAIRKSLKLRELKFKFEREGSRIVYISEDEKDREIY